MKPRVKVRTVAFGSVLLGVALGCSALTLGRVQGMAWVGKPLDVRVLIQSDAGDEPIAGCLSAEVLYGDNPQESSGVTATLVPATDAAGGREYVRVQTATAVNEPIVTLHLRVGCQHQLSRRFTLLADPPTNLVEAPPRSVTVPLPKATVPALATPVVQAVPEQITPEFASPSTETVKSRPAPTTTPTTKAASKPRLKLDSLILLPERDPVLQFSGAWVDIKEDPAKRSEAAAMWLALNVTVQSLQQQDSRFASMDSEIKSLREAMQQDQKRLAALDEKVKLTESERYDNGLVYSLAAFLVLVSLGLVWGWKRWRSQSESNWALGFHAGDSELADAVPTIPSSFSPLGKAQTNPHQLQAPDTTPGSVTPAGANEVDFDLDFIDSLTSKNSAAQAAPEPEKAIPAPVERKEFFDSVVAGARPIDSDEHVSIREHSAFLVSLGQPERAIELLTQRIAQCGDSSPFVGLDLLRLFHSTGRESDFEQLRTQFNRWFAVRVHAFKDFDRQGRALERYPRVLDRIAALWPHADALKYIEGCIYRNSPDGDGVLFDLHAFLDLLFLHGVATILAHPSDDDAARRQKASIPVKRARQRTKKPPAEAAVVVPDAIPISDPDSVTLPGNLTDINFHSLAETNKEHP